MLKVRIKFRKYGVMRFIGHLDVMRYLPESDPQGRDSDRIYNWIQPAYDHVICAAAWSRRDK